MSEVYKLSDCERPEVIIAEVQGLQGSSRLDVPLEKNPTEIYEREKAKAEGGSVAPIPPVIGEPTLDNQIEHLSATVGFDTGVNAKAIADARAVADEALTLCEDATETANQAVETANLANTHSEDAVQMATEAKQIAELSETSAKAHAMNAEIFAKNATASASNAEGFATRSETASADAESSAIRAENAASNLGGIATTQKVGVVKPYDRHFMIDETGELQINREIFQYIQGLFDNCLKSVKQDLSDDQKQQVMQNLGAQGMLISLGRKDLAESVNGGEEKKITFRYTRRVPSTTPINKIAILISRRSEWAEGDEEKVVVSYDGYTSESATIVIRNRGTRPATVRFTVMATMEL